MEHGENQITIIDEDGNETLYEVIFTFESDDFGKSYVFLQPVGESDEEDGSDVLAYAFNPTEDEGGELLPIETDEEWEMVEEVWNTFNEESEEEE